MSACMYGCACVASCECDCFPFSTLLRMQPSVFQEKIIKILFSDSSKLWCFSAHRCNKPGCGSVLVVDGNMKNHHAVCAATEAGYIEYAGLPGSIKSGCTNTPDQVSRFCSLHKPRVLMPKGHHSNDHSNKVIELMLEKKSTRSQNLYEVGCQCL